MCISLSVSLSRLVPSSAEVQLGESHRQASDEAPGVLQLAMVSEGCVPTLRHDGPRDTANDEGHSLENQVMTKSVIFDPKIFEVQQVRYSEDFLNSRAA